MDVRRFHRRLRTGIVALTVVACVGIVSLVGCDNKEGGAGPAEQEIGGGWTRIGFVNTPANGSTYVFYKDVPENGERVYLAVGGRGVGVTVLPLKQASKIEK